MGDFLHNIVPSIKKKGEKNDGEWMALHDEEQFNDFHKLSACVDYRLREDFRAWLLDIPFNLCLNFYYPVVVVQGELWEAYVGKKSLRLVKAKQVQYRQVTFFANKETQNHIDVVREEFFPKYLNIIEREFNETIQRLYRQYPLVNKAAKILKERIQRARDVDEIHRILDYFQNF